ncbi:oxaloacetate decarboxylase [Endozoicomonas sp. GU-1]|uniref:isocitrate lyase/PEP mutase family protein n=1 Tax=Endozoicomonas sp. GU-1 TaxID=3009078 RepID=UPI0022B56316|nr:oxaloacetate decarboxylase [Endozoicomonas sp. GU-1]WBA79487.1 oxaloacetate decarboxylase [Endozoicomonas sp. GU-1]WBA87130.1 oxaloacetate decarboxylase [Endozoicomonas sp. GU-1]
MNQKNNALSRLIAEQGIVTAPGVYDGISARLGEEAGFSALYASGGAIARSTGVPDIGLLTLTEVVDRVRQIVAATSLPVIADADTGFGNEVNVKRTVELFANAGVSAFHLEDQEFPKRCGHLDGKSLVSVDEMCKKVSVARKYAGDVTVIARTDAIAVTGFDDALDRARAYVEAGADMLFVEAPQTIGQIEDIAKQAPGPKLINMFYSGKTPLVPTEDLKAMGYQLIIIPSDLQRAAVTAMREVLQVIRRDGNSGAIADGMMTFQEREQLVKTREFLNP